MTIPGNLQDFKTPTAPGSMSAGPMMTQVVVRSLNTSATPPVAVCEDNMKREISVRMDIQRGKGSIPAVGEFWVIDKSMGAYTFLAYLGGNPTGAGMTSIEGVSGLPNLLADANDSLAEQHARLDTMWTQGTVTAIQGTTNADVTLTDGTSVPGAQVVGSYAPAVGDTVWTSQVDGAGNRAIVGVSASSTVNEQVTNLTATGNVTAATATIAGWRSYINSLGQPALVAPPSGSGITSGGTTLVATLGSDGTTRAAFWAASLLADGAVTAATGVIAGWTMRPSSTSHPALLAVGDNVGIVANGGALYISQAGDTTIRADLYANTGFFNGLNTSSLRIGTAPAPAANQIMTVDLTATHNILVQGTLFYPGGQLPASERSLKHHVTELDDPFEYLDRLVPSRFRFIDTEHFDSREHVGVMVDEMAEADEATVIYPPMLPDEAAEAEVVARYRANHGRRPDERALIAYLVRACQRLHARVRDLERGEEVADADPGASKR